MNYAPFRPLDREIPCDLCGEEEKHVPMFKTETPNYFCQPCFNHLIRVPDHMETVIEDYVSGNVV